MSKHAEPLVASVPLLRVDDLRVGFWSRGRWHQAVDGASVHLGQHEGLAVIGESGSGKTLTMMSSLALIPSNPGVIGGSIRYHDGTDEISLLDGVEDAYQWEQGKCRENTYTEKWRLEYRRRARYLAGLKIGIIFQNPISSLDPMFSVGATLVESIRLWNPSLSHKEAYEEATDWLDRVHIKNPSGVMRSYPHQLSGGMCQRVMIAATLSMRPRIIIADEPTTGLDMTTKAQILFLLHEARTKYGSSLIFVTHEIGLVTGLTERVVVMRDGQVVDRFPTSHLAGVARVGGQLQTTHSFAPHTRELLISSLKLEGDAPVGEPELEEADDDTTSRVEHVADEAVRDCVEETVAAATEIQVSSEEPSDAASGSSDNAALMLEVQSLAKLYPLRQSLWDRIQRRPRRFVRAVNHVSLSIAPGEVVGLVGESGCGKTTLGKLICRLIEPTSGGIQLQGRDLLRLPKEELRQLRPRFQMLFQNPYSTLNPKMTVKAMLEETLEVNTSVPNAERPDKIREVLEQVGLPHKLQSYPTELSGGERRRVGLARLLLLQPSLIVADEPVAGLDASIKAKVVDLIMETRQPGMSYIFISHDLHVIRYVADRILVMFLGSIVEELPVQTFGGDCHHPYSLNLLHAARQVTLRKSIDAQVDFADLPSHTEAPEGGCPYVHRCPWAGVHVPKERCLQEVPPLHSVASGHRIACHRFEPT